MIIATSLDFIPERRVRVHAKNLSLLFRESLTKLKNNQFEITLDLDYDQLTLGDIFSLGYDKK